jgi:alkaline phosphatase
MRKLTIGHLAAGILATGFAISVLASTALQAQTIYPIDRAEILAGSHFDVKVEFPGSPTPRPSC